MTATLTIAGVDVSADTIADVQITAGRDDIDTQPDATVLSAETVGWRPAGRVGDPIVCADPYGRMFAGTITDLSTTLEEAWDGEQVSMVWRTRINATGPLADVGRVIVGDEPWPQESDSERVARILTLAGAGHVVDTNVLGPAILARDVDAQPAAELARGVADDALGVLWEQPADTAGTPIRYQPARLRTWGTIAVAWQELSDTTWGAAPDTLTWEQVDTGSGALPGDPGILTLPAGEVDHGVTLTQSIGDLASAVRVTYGTAPEGGERPYETAGAGVPEVGMTTDLASAGDALAVADSVWRTHREPRWRMREVAIYLHTLDAARVAEIRAGLAVGTRLTITGIGFDGPTGPLWEGYLEGWHHSLDEAGHTLFLRTSERALTEPADRWLDLTGVTWAGLDDALVWADAADMP